MAKAKMPFKVSFFTGLGRDSRQFDDLRKAARFATSHAKWQGSTALFEGRTPLMHCTSEQADRRSVWNTRHASCTLTAAGKAAFKKAKKA